LETFHFEIRDRIRRSTLAEGAAPLVELVAVAALDDAARTRISERAVEVIKAVRVAGAEIMKIF